MVDGSSPTPTIVTEYTYMLGVEDACEKQTTVVLEVANDFLYADTTRGLLSYAMGG
jgi:hypothetical protein